MKSFKDFGIEVPHESFTGDKIKVNKIINREITVIDFKIEDSKFSGKRLTLQIEYEGERRVLFTSSKGLSAAIQQVPKDGFPFTTTIVEENDRYEFT